MGKKWTDENLVTEEEVAKRTGFTVQQIRNFRRRSEIDFYRFPTRNGLPFGAIRYDIADVMKFMEKYKFLSKQTTDADVA